MKRILTPSDWGLAMAKRYRPAMLFTGRTQRDYQAWRAKFEPKFHDMLGRMPEKVPLRAQVLQRREFAGYVREKVVFDSEPCQSVIAWICRPRERGKYPAVICAAGHGRGGKVMVGLDAQGRPSYDYAKNLAIRMAKAGFFAIAPDWRAFGERHETVAKDPGPRDLCNLSHLVAQHFGFNQLGLNVWDAMRTIDYMATRPEVDIRKVGCVGCSFGGTMTMALSAMDNRVGAACISGYLGSTMTALSNYGTCGSQTLSGLLQWGDRAEVAGLICPRPLLIQVGQYDSSFDSNDALSAYKRLQSIYLAAGKEDRLGLDLFDGCHEINVEPIMEWFTRWLTPRER
ncbi:MAG: dienelactone hydrolase family protein [Phycisphaeraceae bacterium]|nr:dienelactone hydrolase family protein [Phycisphaeraceae bacterium]